ncbi:MAG: fibrinogen-like YCDxxxxGGGW domain-containing protein, partial [bacterium]
IALNGGLLNIVGVYPDVREDRGPGRGLNEFSGRCQGQRCDFWLADTNNGSCLDGGFEPNGNNTPESALVRQPLGDCGSGSWDDQLLGVEIGGFVVCSPNDAGPAPRSCLDALELGLRINPGGRTAEGQNGVYQLDTDGPDGPLAPYEAWCQQDVADGGWTLALKTQADSAFRYDHPVWTHDRPVNERETDLGISDSMYASYLQLPVHQAMLRMGDGEVVVDLPPGTPSMRSVMAGGYLQTHADRFDWINMVADRMGGLQQNCNAQGFNVDSALRRVRFGILGNNEPDCSSPDSFIGIGHSAEAACGDLGIISGNNAGTRCAGERVSLRLQGYLFVREAAPRQP